MTLRLRFNGLDHAFLSEFGCTCGRCTSAVRRANTSVSLLELSEGNQDVKRHILFDVGMGVTDSLVTSPLPSSATRLDGMVVSHWHPDHAIEMNRLCESWLRSRQRRQEEPGKVRIWCRQGTANWLERLYPYEWNHLLAPVVLPGDYPPGTVLGAIDVGVSDVEVTPISVSHDTADFDAVSRQRLQCSAGFVLRHARSKAVLLWDIDNTNDWILHPQGDEKRTVELCSKADYLIADCNTWKTEEAGGRSTGHTSFSTLLGYAQALEPRVTYLVHLSGHEDGPGNPGWGWDDGTWARMSQAAWKEASAPGIVLVPHIGLTVEL